MRKSRRFWLKLCAALVGTILVGVLVLSITAVPILAGYKAKILASGVFVARRSFESVLDHDVDPLARWLNWSINQDEQSVTVSLRGFASRTAKVHEGLGATLLPPGEETVAFDPGYALLPVPEPDLDAYWPLGDDTSKHEITAERREALDAAVDWAFAAPAPGENWGTRAVIVAQSGNVLSERYNRGFAMSMPLHGWSMSKSIVNALIGVLVKEGRLDIHAPAPVPAWDTPGDPRSAITASHLLQMSSGLAFNEGYTNPYGDVLPMLFLQPDMAKYAAVQPLAAAPGSVWSYSSGTTNVLCGILRRRIGGADTDYFNFPRTALFGKLGMTSAILEPDSTGTFVGSSYCYATARDWARFGQFYLQDGVWNGERLLPEGWVAYSTTPAPAAPLGQYGAHWWLNSGAPGAPDHRPFPSLPRDLFYASGHEGQYLVIVPSREVVIVRLGMTRGLDFDFETFVRQILDALE